MPPLAGVYGMLFGKGESLTRCLLSVWSRLLWYHLASFGNAADDVSRSLYASATRP